LHVEHFRPKRSAKDRDGTSHAGYWWLALDWHNFPNLRERGEHQEGDVLSIAKTDVRRARAPGADLRLEVPLLLDPADPYDPTLLTFNVEGHARAAAHLAAGWERDRAEYSIERLKLDFPALMDKRRLLWAECWQRIRSYLDELALLGCRSGQSDCAYSSEECCSGNPQDANTRARNSPRLRELASLGPATLESHHYCETGLRRESLRSHIALAVPGLRCGSAKSPRLRTGLGVPCAHAAIPESPAQLALVLQLSHSGCFWLGLSAQTAGNMVGTFVQDELLAFLGVKESDVIKPSVGLPVFP